MSSSRRFSTALLSLLSVFALVSCATREQPAAPPAPTQAAFPATLSAPDGKQVVLERQPVRIVSLSPTATEVLYAIGAGKQVVAVDDQSNFPAEAPRTQLSGFKPNVEAITKQNPDLVVVAADANDVVGGLTAVKVPVLLLPTAKTLDEAYAQWTLLGRATGRVQQADDVVRTARDEIKKTVDATPRKPLKYYHELGPDLYSATSATFIGRVYGQFGLVNVADPADTPATGGYPQLGQQALFQANPDLIFLSDTKCCAQTAETVRARPQWQTLTAVQKNNIVALDDDIASRWGPRIIDLVKQVADAVKRAGA
ncbi:ABC transporter substrate-binding protein [Kibdelosporangium phytohabitans]|uniref:ABC transporter substrate-binding protein n=1 Tax=Kibdelosporangium phytohabitans TaxID=860235 RepID=A0A0N7F4Z2_9PSEU|nr:ABC transporter substrate-binding protein [Kibdelosporangium phytohabitans]ALG12783.1 ABC transporter substrate-binding protein [Kibdelosporangium phytohabitans]MBE1464460.1 iron complex transport system substrate-binding protein [Kibdelosporangium phytohabitans]